MNSKRFKIEFDPESAKELKHLYEKQPRVASKIINRIDLLQYENN